MSFSSHPQFVHDLMFKATPCLIDQAALIGTYFGVGADFNLGGVTAWIYARVPGPPLQLDWGDKVEA